MNVVWQFLKPVAVFLAENLWRRWFQKECDHNWTDVASSGAGKLQECLRCSQRRFNPPAPPAPGP